MGAWLLPTRAEACSCVAPPAPKVALQRSTAVFEGKVVALERKPELHRLTARFEVSRVWKGELTTRAEVSTIDVGSMCGYGFEVGSSYVVYAAGEATGLSTSACTRTKVSADAKDDLTALGAGTVPAPAPPEAAVVAVAPVTAVAAVVPVAPVAAVALASPVAADVPPSGGGCSVATDIPPGKPGCVVGGQASPLGLLWLGLLAVRRRRTRGQ